MLSFKKQSVVIPTEGRNLLLLCHSHRREESAVALSFRPEGGICCPLSSRLQKSITKFGLSFRPEGGIRRWLRATRYLVWLQTLLLTRSAKPPSAPLPNWSSCEAFLLTTNRPL